MTIADRATAPGVPEAAKLLAFLRRDLLVLRSYRFAMAGDALNLVVQALSFYFVGLLVDPDRMPSFGGTRASYLAFVVVGIAFGAFLQVGLTRIVAAIRNEQLMGTLEPLFMTPTRPTTLQLGLVSYDLLYVPLRTALFLGIVTMVFGLNLEISGADIALVTLLLFMPLVWGLGLVSAAGILTFRRGGGMVGLAGAVVTIGSGAYFPLELLPDWIQGVLGYNPVAVAFTTARAALLGGESWATLAPNLLFLAPVGIVSLLVGLGAFSLALRRERRQGTLHLY